MKIGTNTWVNTGRGPFHESMRPDDMPEKIIKGLWEGTAFFCVHPPAWHYSYRLRLLPKEIRELRRRYQRAHKEVAALGRVLREVGVDPAHLQDHPESPKARARMDKLLRAIQRSRRR